MLIHLERYQGTKPLQAEELLMSQIRGSEFSQHNQAKHSARNVLGMLFPGCWPHPFDVITNSEPGFPSADAPAALL